MSTEILEISVVVPISERHDDIEQLYHLYAEELELIVNGYEFVFIVDGGFERAYKALLRLKHQGYPVTIVKFSRSFGESVALMEGFQQAKSNHILTLASYIQVEPSELKKVIAEYKKGYDLIITRRYPRKDPLINRIQSKVYHYLVNKLTGVPYRDITSGLRMLNKQVIDELNFYGDLHRFIPIFAAQKGLKVKEIPVAQRKEDTGLRLVNPGTYVRRLLDILTLFFLIKFTWKPLRFFGLIGAGLFIPGLLLTLYLAILRIAGKIGLSNQPILLLGILLMVFGIQILSVGLIGELILFNQAKDIKNYSVEKVIE